MHSSARRIDIRALSIKELAAYVEEMNEQPFRARQIYEWLWKKSALSFAEMTNLSKTLRGGLERDFIINHIREESRQESVDGTIKIRFALYDGYLIEGVVIPTSKRVTACVSSQAGCSLSCKFCATGLMGLKRNLNADEIYDQVTLLSKLAMDKFGRPLTNIVFMGMGEPLLNYRNVVTAIDKITGEDGLEISPKRITVSTAGIAKMIKKLANEKVRFNLALSLHAANDTKRSKIMPINESNSLEALIDAMKEFYLKTKNKITFEYILFDGVNDGVDDASELVALCKQAPAKVNIIEYNPVDGIPFKKSARIAREKFVAFLETHGVITNVRISRGKDIHAACGQLANKGN